MNRFILLLNHDDVSLSAYLENCLQKGWQFVKASGNIFTFKKSAPSDDRIRVVTYVNEDPDLKMKFQMEDYSALMKKRGWKVLDIGKPEDIFDSKRHVFLQTDQPDAKEPVIDPELGAKAKRREKRSLIRCLAMLLLLLGFAIFFLGNDPDVFLSSNHIFFPGIAGFVFWLISLIYCFRGIAAEKNKNQCKNDFKNYLHVDKAVLHCMISIGALFAALLFDLFLYPDTGRIIVKGEKRIKVYQDVLPLTMDDLSIRKEGLYHSSRLTERNGILMRSLYASEQSFNSPDNIENLSLISYSVYRSAWKTGLDWVESKKGFRNLPVSEDLKIKWNSDSVHTDGVHRMSVRYPDKLLVFLTSTEISEIDISVVLDKLISNQ